MRPSSEIRETFLKYFEDRGHKRVKSGPLVPRNDPTLLFANAGMNQFKEVFLGQEKRDYLRAATSQKCMRVSGKHNDLETVGRTARHHTFFEMLGNFSFGDYFKKKAVEFAWELCTEVYGLPADRLRITVFREDDEAYELWHRHVGIAESRIFRLGEKENFWSMGETGPCGPCSEIHFDHGTSPLGHTDCDPECSCGRFLEIWNLVFMQFDRDSGGTLNSLPQPSIDTGMGLERITSLIQGVNSNYDTDLFIPILNEAGRMSGHPYGEDPDQDTSLRILADHSRSCMFLIDDGVVPGNDGRGYVLRKILRRAIRHGRLLGMHEPFIFTLTALVGDLMKEAYPELEKSRDYAAKVVRYEEEKFSVTLDLGLERLDEVFEKTRKAGQKQVSGADIFKLYDTFGFPLDLARDIAEERGFRIDEEGFGAELEKQRVRARASWKGGATTVEPIFKELAEEGLSTEFLGYEEVADVSSQVLLILQENQRVDSLPEGESGQVILTRSPFYAEAGGQVGDRGSLEGDSVYARVEDTVSPVSGIRLHTVQVARGSLTTGQKVVCRVETDQRLRTTRNHTATHLLHAALRDVLGEHVKQAGSLVAPDRLRFDFTHYRPLGGRAIRHLEELVNEKIRQNIAVQTKIRSLDEAIQDGAMALFGEKYQEQVRVVSIPGFSMELCGGTHVSRTGDISLFKITSEGSISAGVRRVEAITGSAAVERFLDDEAILQELTNSLKVPTARVQSSVEQLSQELKESQRELERLRLELAQKQAGSAVSQARDVAGVRVVSRRVENLDRGGFRTLADNLCNQLGSGVVVLGMADNGKVSLIAMVSADLTDKLRADQLIRQIAPLIKGGGGGRADMAEAGGKDASRLDEALENSFAAVAASLKA